MHACLNRKHAVCTYAGLYVSSKSSLTCMDNVREDLEERGIRLSIAYGQTRKHAVCTYAGIEMSGVCTYAGIEKSGEA